MNICNTIFNTDIPDKDGDRDITECSDDATNRSEEASLKQPSEMRETRLRTNHVHHRRHDDNFEKSGPTNRKFVCNLLNFQIVLLESPSFRITELNKDALFS